jgi:hypothetical protein
MANPSPSIVMLPPTWPATCGLCGGSFEPIELSPAEMIQAQGRPACFACARTHYPDLFATIRRRAVLWHAKWVMEREDKRCPANGIREGATISLGLFD